MFSILGTDGKEYGPVSVAKIEEWIAAGRANLQTKARRTSETEWHPLADFPEFNPASAPAPEAPAGPAAAPVPPSDSGQPGIELADRGTRLGAVLLDSLVGGLLALPGLAILVAAGVFSRPDAPNAPLMLAGLGTCGLALLLLLGVQIYLLSTRGQTIGKKILRIRIVDFADGGNPGFVKAVLLRVILNGIAGSIPVLGMAYSLADILFIFRDDRRCIHDLLAGTQVVKA